MRGGKHVVALAGMCGAAGLAAGCGIDRASPERVEAQVERQVAPHARFVECDRAASDQRYTCRVETSSDRFRYVATCPDAGHPCTIRRTRVELR